MDTLTLFKVSEMVEPSRSPKPVLSAGAGLGAVPATVAFLDASGSPITSVESGQPYGFNVTGYANVWLVLKKDGAVVYNANFAVPMALHQAQDSEIGSWQAAAYDPNNGQLIGSAQLQIVAAGGTTGTGGLLAWLSTLTTTQKAIGAGAILFILARRKKR